MADLTWGHFDSLYPRLPANLSMGRQQFTAGRHLEVLLRLCLQKQPASILELYTACGDTTLALARACPHSRITTVDICVEMGIGKQTGEVPTLEQVGEAFRNQPERQRITQHVADPKVFKWHRVPLADVVFIDGDHSYEGVLHDTVMALMRSTDYALIVWDDYWPPCPEIIRFINDLNDPYNFLFRVLETRVVFGYMDPDRKSFLLRRITDLSCERGITINALSDSRP